MPAVTVSASYGAGGSPVARGLSERLGYQLLDRAISSTVSQILEVSAEEAEEGALRRGFVEKFFGPLAGMTGAVINPSDGAAISAGLVVGNDQAFRESAERIMRDAMPDGAVILGRGGAAAFHGLPDVMTVRLFGSAERRIVRAAAAEGVGIDTAATRLVEVDKARAKYVRHLYAADIDDPALFDLQIDGTLVPPAACIEIIAVAFAAFLAHQVSDHG